MTKKDLRKVCDATLFDAGDVTWEVEETKRNTQIKILLKSESRFNLVKIYLSLQMIVEKLEGHLGVMENTEGEH